MSAVINDPAAVPVTVILTAAQAVRLESLTAHWRGVDPSMDDNTITDIVFSTGLAAFEQIFAMHPEHAA